MSEGSTFKRVHPFTAGTFPAKTYQQSIVLTKLRRIKFEKMFSFMMTCSIITSNDILDCKEILILFVIKQYLCTELMCLKLVMDSKVKT